MGQTYRKRLFVQCKGEFEVTLIEYDNFAVMFYVERVVLDRRPFTYTAQQNFSLKIGWYRKASAISLLTKLGDRASSHLADAQQPFVLVVCPAAAGPTWPDDHKHLVRQPATRPDRPGAREYRSDHL